MIAFLLSSSPENINQKIITVRTSNQIINAMFIFLEVFHV